MFSYYVGIGGYNQDFRYLDQFNGSNLGDVWGYPTIAYNTANLYFGGVFPTCGYTPPSGSGYYDGPNASPVYDPFPLKPGPARLRAAARTASPTIPGAIKRFRRRTPATRTSPIAKT